MGGVQGERDVSEDDTGWHWPSVVVIGAVSSLVRDVF